MPDTQVVHLSGVYKTAPVGKTDQNDFLNAAIEISCRYSPEQLLAALQDIETRLGRRRIEKWGPRTIDLDILSIESVVHNEEKLTIPHPELAHRRFVLVPFAEIAPDYVVPGIEKSVHKLLQQCRDQNKVELFMTSHAFQNQLKEVES